MYLYVHSRCTKWMVCWCCRSWRRSGTPSEVALIYRLRQCGKFIATGRANWLRREIYQQQRVIPIVFSRKNDFVVTGKQSLFLPTINERKNGEWRFSPPRTRRRRRRCVAEAVELVDFSFYVFFFLSHSLRGKAHPPRTEAECLSMFFTARPALSAREKWPPLIFLLYYRFSLVVSTLARSP